MPHIELRTNDPGDVAQLLIDGQDVSYDVTAATITYDVYQRPKGHVTVTYKADRITIDGNFTEKETNE